MKKNLFITLPFVLLSAFGFSQSMFQKVFEKDYTTAYGTQQTADGGYIVAGLYQVSATNFDYLAVKLSAVGDTLWTKTYGGIGDEESYAMQQTTDGGFIFAGIDSSSGLGSYNIYLVKTNSLGDTLWTKSYGGHQADFAQAVQQTADGGYIVAGYTSSFSIGGDNDVYLLKTDANGNLTWSKTYGGAYGDYANAVKQTSDGGYIVAGLTSSFGISPYGNINDVYVLKTDANGNLTWSKTYGQDGDDWAYGIINTNEGYTIIGHTNTDSIAALSDVYLIKTDINGDTLFTKSYGGASYDKGTALLQTSDSGFVVIGSTYSFGNGTSDVYFIRTNKHGTVVSNSTFGNSDNDWAYALFHTSDDGFALAGYTNNFSVSNSSFYFLKTDNYGRGNNCHETNPATITSNTATKISNPATIINTPATITKQNTFTKISSGVSVIDVCSFSTGIKQTSVKQQTAFTVYPNPSNGNFSINTTDYKENTQVIIYNQLGQIVLNTQLNNQLTNFNLDINAGVYQVRVLNGNEVIYQTKIIKE